MISLRTDATQSRPYLSSALKGRPKYRVLGAGVEPAYLTAPEPKSGVSAIPPPEQTCAVQICGADPIGKRFAEGA